MSEDKNMTIAYVTAIGTGCYYAGVTCGRKFASAFALVGALSAISILVR